MNPNKNNGLSTYNQQYKKAWGLRNNGNDNNERRLKVPIDDSAYEIPLDNDELNELTNLFNGLKTSQSYDRDLASVVSASTELKPVINLESIVTTDPNKKEQNIIVLISNLWISMCKLPLTVLSMITPSGNNINFLYKQFFLILNTIFSVLRALSQTNIGCCVLLLFICAIYQTQWGYATIQFCFGVFLYLYTNFPANIGIDSFIEKIKVLALAWLALIMQGPFVTWGTSILSSITTSTQALTQAAQTTTAAAQTASMAAQTASMTAQTALESVQLMSNNVPQQLITALNSPDGRLAIKQALESSAIMGSLALAWKNQEIFYDETLLPQLNKIGNVLTSTSNNIEDVKLITQNIGENVQTVGKDVQTVGKDVNDLKQIVTEDFNAINDLMFIVKNNQQLSAEKMKEILKLVDRNLQTTDLGRLINANGLTPDTIIGFLTATQQNLSRLMGKRQLLLQNGEMGGTIKRTLKKTVKTKNKSVKKKTVKTKVKRTVKTKVKRNVKTKVKKTSTNKKSKSKVKN